MSITERLLKVFEVATLLKVAKSTVWLWVKQGRIKSVRLPAAPGAKKGAAIRDSWLITSHGVRF
jgi:hypothetical protein